MRNYPLCHVAKWERRRRSRTYFFFLARKSSHYSDVHEHCRAVKAFIGGLKDEKSIYMWHRQRSSDVRVFEQDFKRAAATHLEKLKPSLKKTTRVLGNLRKVKIIRFTKYKKATATKDLEKLEPCSKMVWLCSSQVEGWICMYKYTHAKSIINY